MNQIALKKLKLPVLALSSVVLAACGSDSSSSKSSDPVSEPTLFETTLNGSSTEVMGPSTKRIPDMVATAEGVKIISLLSNGYLDGNYSPAQGLNKNMLPYYESVTRSDSDKSDYALSGNVDGMGYLDNGDGTFTLLMNQEHYNFGGGEASKAADSPRKLGNTGSFIASWRINKQTGEVISGEDFIDSIDFWDGSSAYYNKTDLSSYTHPDTIERFCSATLAPVSAFYNSATGKGTQERIFTTGEESDGYESFISYYDGISKKGGGYKDGDFEVEVAQLLDLGGKTLGRAFAVMVTGDEKGKAIELPALGKVRFENIVPRAYEMDKTVIVITDDSKYQSSKPAANGGFVMFYQGEKRSNGSSIERAGLTDGQLFALKFADYTVMNHDAEGNDVSQEGVGYAALDRGLEFTLAPVSNHASVKGMNQLDFRNATVATGAAQFRSAEDVVWDPQNPKVVYWADYFGLYMAVFNDVEDITKGGKAYRLLKRDNDKQMYKFDNLEAVVGKDGITRVAIQIDNGDMLSPIFVYNTSTREATKVAEFNPEVFGEAGKYGASESQNYRQFYRKSSNEEADVESSAIIYAGDILGEGWFIIGSQQHFNVESRAEVFGTADTLGRDKLQLMTEGGQLMAIYIPQMLGE